MGPGDFELGEIIGRIDERTTATASDVSDMKTDMSDIKGEVHDLKERVGVMEQQYISWWFRLPKKTRREIVAGSAATILAAAATLIELLTGFISTKLGF